MKLKYEFEKMNLGGENIAVPVGEGSKNLHFILKLNETGSRILDILKDDVAEAEIVELLAQEYGTDGRDIAGCVSEFIEQLKEAELITD